jgi:nicotinate-nucleotide adenylyltransferase
MAVAADSRFRVSTVDMDRPGPHYSVDTLALLATQFELGPDQLHFIMGSDSLEQLHTWYRPGDLACRCRLAVIERPGSPVDLGPVVARVPETEGRVDLVPMPMVGISSSTLRRMAAEGRSLRYWVPPAVEAIIGERRLYRPSPPRLGGPD